MAFDVKKARNLALGPVYDSPAYDLPTIGTVQRTLTDACDEIDRLTSERDAALARAEESERKLETLRITLEWACEEHDERAEREGLIYSAWRASARSALAPADEETKEDHADKVLK